MEVINRLEDLKPGRKSVVTIGVFDGVHIGHQAIMQTVTKMATDQQLRSVAITFDRNPEEVLHSWVSTPCITTLSQKLRHIERQGIDTTVVLPVKNHVLSMSAQEFVAEVLIDRLSATTVVVGTDFVFGRDRQGSLDFLRHAGAEKGFDVVVSRLR